MFYDNELRFLCDILNKSHITTALIGEDESFFKDADINIFSPIEEKVNLKSIVDSIKHSTVYQVNDLLNRKYIFFLLPDIKEKTALVIGPYLSLALSSKQIIEWSEKHNIDARKQKMIQEYYSSLPIIRENSHIFLMLETFWELLWGIGGFKTVEVNPRFSENFIAKLKGGTPDEEENAIIKMEMMEKRYSYENDMINAVVNGQIHKTDYLMSMFSEISFEKRVTDQLRNLKNYSIIMNTLLRKAAEKGGVHPIYINSISSEFAVKIENAGSYSAIQSLMGEMFRNYCRLVRKHTMKHYSPPIQKAIVCIDTDLTADLSLKNLAALQNISPAYLSSIFKKETGMTLTEFVNNRRIKNAMKLLETTKIQIQTVAQYSGIDDINYFAKLFKRHTGMTPKQYRQSVLMQDI